MNKFGVTLIELLIVIVVMGLIAAFSVITVGNIVENTAVKVDEQNAEILEDVMKTAYLDGTLTIKNNRVWNNSSNRGYSGTGSWFFEDMDGYLENRVRPQSEVAKNRHNIDGDGLYKFWFLVSGDDVSIFYWDENRQRVILSTFEMS